MKNLALFEQVAEHVLPTPEKLFMSSWVGDHPYRAESKEEALCSTTACVAGWACILSGEAKLVTKIGVSGKPHKYWQSPSDGWEDGGMRLFGPEDEDEEIALSILFFTGGERALEVLDLVANKGTSLPDAIAQTGHLA